MASVLRSLALLLLVLLPATAAAAAGASELKLWYAQPATQWTDALPIGSGKLGAMVFGGVGEERIQFNEHRLWTGKPHDYVRAGAHDSLAKIQELVFAG